MAVSAKTVRINPMCHIKFRSRLSAAAKEMKFECYYYWTGVASSLELQKFGITTMKITNFYQLTFNGEYCIYLAGKQRRRDNSRILLFGEP